MLVLGCCHRWRQRWRCSVCTLVGVDRLLARRAGGLPAMAAGAGLWFGCIASSVCLGQHWLLL